MRASIKGVAALLAAVALAIVPSRAAAQQRINLTGVVRDSTSGRQLAGVIVSLDVPGGSRTTRTDDDGNFGFSKVLPGLYPMTFRRLGYQAVSRSVEARVGMDTVLVAMTRVAALDTVRVRATNQGVYGVVGTAHTLRPLPGSTVQVFGHGKTTADSAGRFFISIKDAGAYMLRATSPGYEDQTVSVTVRANEGVEMALLLDSATTPQSHRWAQAYVDLADRMIARRNSSAIVSASELRESGESGLVAALRRSPSFQRGVIRFGGSACVFVDGVSKPGFSIEAFDALEVEAIEVYTKSSEGTGNLARRWPNGFPCAPTGEPTTAASTDVAYWVVIWLKR